MILFLLGLSFPPVEMSWLPSTYCMHYDTINSLNNTEITDSLKYSGDRLFQGSPSEAHSCQESR